MTSSALSEDTVGRLESQTPLQIVFLVCRFLLPNHILPDMKMLLRSAALLLTTFTISHGLDQFNGIAKRKHHRNGTAAELLVTGSDGLCPALFPNPGPILFFHYPSSVLVPVTESSTSIASTSIASTSLTSPSPTATTATPTPQTSTTTAVACGPTSQVCEVTGCAGSFAGGRGTCQSQQQMHCSCDPTNKTPGFQCGGSEACDGSDGCNGSFNNDGSATCKGFGSGCTCKPSAAMCGTAQSCDAGGCGGTFIEKCAMSTTL